MMRFVLGASVGAAVLVALACGGKGAAPAPTPAGAAPTTVTVRAVRTIRWERDELTAPAGHIRVRFINEDTGVPHDFAVYRDESHRQLLAKTGLCTAPCEETLELDLSPGMYHFMCTVHPGQMEGEIMVR
ncbi:hypothetical protein HRbin24_00135 [bacterium HR24]|nr:hypothetical protein HRbin24_00135 [bacterium HR24]